MKMIRVLVVCALVAAAQAQQYYCSVFGGVCGTGCSSYRTSSLPLCPSGLRCCNRVSSTNHCTTRYGGSCVNQGTACSGKLYKGSGFDICPNALQLCCVAGTGGTVTQAPTNPPKVNPTSGSGCGTSRVLGTNRVVGGANAQKGAWPWQVSMLKNGGHSCGGTLINDQWVLTAGHCFRSYTQGMRLEVAVGDHYIRSRDGSESVITVSNIFVHSSFDRTNPANNANDIALMKLSRKVQLGSNTVNSACLPSQGESFQSAQECYVTGWGLTRGTQDRYTLQQVKGPIVPDTQCKRYWGSKVTSGVICHGNGQHGACKGDSGGPLVCRKSGKFTLVGVVSFGTPECNKYPYPTVYTRVANYRNWIDQTIRSNP